MHTFFTGNPVEVYVAQGVMDMAKSISGQPPGGRNNLSWILYCK
jgi:hypothetical protein